MAVPSVFIVNVHQFGFEDGILDLTLIPDPFFNLTLLAYIFHCLYMVQMVLSHDIMSMPIKNS